MSTHSLFYFAAEGGELFFLFLFISLVIVFLEMEVIHYLIMKNLI